MSNICAQSNIIDTSFNIGKGFNRSINAIVTQTDGKIIVAGDFSRYNSKKYEMIVRLNTDGSFDTTFNKDNIFYYFGGSINTVVLQNDGKIIVGGSFTPFKGYRNSRIARLNSNGTFDTSFNTHRGFNSTVWSILIQPNGKIVVGGEFSKFNKIKSRIITRLNLNGTLDTAFNTINGFNSNNTSVYSIARQTDGKLILAGAFVSFNKAKRHGILRLFENGNLDTTFNPGKGFNFSPLSCAIQSDGKIIVSGYFTKFNNTKYINLITRLSPDGELDTSFKCLHWFNREIRNRWYTEYFEDLVPIVKIQSDDKFYIVVSTIFNSVVKLNADGTIDESFNKILSFDSRVNGIDIQADGKIIVVGRFSRINKIRINRMVRLNN